MTDSMRYRDVMMTYDPISVFLITYERPNLVYITKISGLSDRLTQNCASLSCSRTELEQPHAHHKLIPSTRSCPRWRGSCAKSQHVGQAKFTNEMRKVRAPITRVFDEHRKDRERNITKQRGGNTNTHINATTTCLNCSPHEAVW